VGLKIFISFRSDRMTMEIRFEAYSTGIQKMEEKKTVQDFKMPGWAPPFEHFNILFSIFLIVSIWNCKFRFGFLFSCILRFIYLVSSFQFQNSSFVVVVVFHLNSPLLFCNSIIFIILGKEYAINSIPTLYTMKCMWKKRMKRDENKKELKMFVAKLDKNWKVYNQHQRSRHSESEISRNEGKKKVLKNSIMKHTKEIK
jgi:predicted membrane protein